MAHGRAIAILLALLAPALLPAASGYVTYSFSTQRTEYLLGETVSFRIYIWPTEETFQVTERIHITRETSGSYWGSVGSGTLRTVPSGSATVITILWNTQTAFPPPLWGRYRAEFATPHGTLITHFDLSYAPDLTIHNVSIEHPPAAIRYPFLRDGVAKTVYGCVDNIGKEPTTAATVSLFYRLHIDPLLFGGLENPRVATADWRNGHVVDQKIVNFAYPTQQCFVNNLPRGWLVRFEWRATDDLAELSPLLYSLGLRVDAAKQIWETDETNNDYEKQTTASPLNTILP